MWKALFTPAGMSQLNVWLHLQTMRRRLIASTRDSPSNWSQTWPATRNKRNKCELCTLRRVLYLYLTLGDCHHVIPLSVKPTWIVYTASFYTPLMAGILKIPTLWWNMLFKLHCREHCIRIGISIIKVDSFLIL